MSTAKAEINRKIGVIGGMGPAATAHFLTRLVALTPAKDDADHIPVLVDNNPQIESRIDYIINRRGDSPARTLAAMARALEKNGAAALAMPCNTAHWFADDITRAVNIPLLNMINLSVADVAQRLDRGGSIGMLASPAVRKTQIFDSPSKDAGFELIFSFEDRLLNLIKMIKAEGGSRTAETELRSIASAFRDQGAKFLLIACSELSIIASALSAEFDAIDTLDVLARASIAFSRPASAVSISALNSNRSL